VEGVVHSTLPPLDIVGPDGVRLTLRALDRNDTAGLLAQRLGSDALWATRELHPNERLADIDELRFGTRLTRSRPASTSGDESSIVEVAVVAGPAVTTWRSLPVGRSLIGRARYAGIQVDDPAIEAHHAVLQTEEDGAIGAVQLTGSVPMRIDGRVVDAATQPVVGSRIALGSSVIELRAPSRVRDQSELAQRHGGIGVGTGFGTGVGSLAAHPSDPWRRIVWRAPYEQERWGAPVVIAPAAPMLPQRPALAGLIGAGVTAVGAMVVALVMRNPMVMMFALMGVGATVVTYAVGVGTSRRERRRVQADHRQTVDRFRAALSELRRDRFGYHIALVPTAVDSMTEVFGDGTRLWQRRVRPDAASDLVAAIGTGTHRWAPPIEVRDPNGLDAELLQAVEQCSRLDGVAARVTIRPGDSLAFSGALDLACSLARSVVAQLATWIGPADWQLVVVTSDERAWRWADWLPHGALDGASVIVAMPGSDEAMSEQLDAIDLGRRTLLVTDEPHLFTARTGALRRFVSASNAASLVLVDGAATVPAICRRVLTIGSTGSASWSGDVPESDDAVGIEFAGLSIDTADAVARRLACLVDPEDGGGVGGVGGGGVGGGVPSAVSFADLIGSAETTAHSIAERWRAGGRDPAPIAPLGVTVDGRVDIDLVRDGPHGLIAGTTGAGKSELLRTLVLSLAATVSPQHLNFVLVDYKGGSTFDACTALPHTVGVVTDLDNGLAERALVSLDAELHRRERLLRSVGAADLTDYRARRFSDAGDFEPIARLVVVIDEFATLAKELPDFLSALVGVAQRGRSLGVHLLLATQRPAGVVNDDIRANTNLRLALRLHDRPDAIDVVGSELPARFPRGLPGRAVLRLGPDELVVFQAARCTGPVVLEGDGIIVDRFEKRRTAPSNQIELSDGDTELPSELLAVTQAIVAAATAEGLDAAHRPWVEPLPFPLTVDDVYAGLTVQNADEVGAIGAMGAVVGLLDDPAHQCRRLLSWQPSDGGLALIGSIGAGTTSTMISLAAGICALSSPTDLHLYVIDARGDDGLAALAALAHCAGVVRISEDERLHRLLAEVVNVIDRRLAVSVGRSSPEPDVVVMIDGYGSLRNALSAIERMETFDLLVRAVTDGPAAGVAFVVADDASTAIQSLAVTSRWIFHLDDPSAARGLGLRTAPAATNMPGRFRVLASGLEGQIAHGAAGLAALPTRDQSPGGPRPIEALAARVRLGLSRGIDVERDQAGDAQAGRDADGANTFGVTDTLLRIGLSGVDLLPTSLRVAAGDHVLVIGAPRTGVSTALARCVAALEHELVERAVPHVVVRIDRRTARSGDLVDPDLLTDCSRDVAIVVDEAHRIDDNGTLLRIAQGEFAHVTLLVGARADGVRSAYGHWTREVAKSRCGVVMTSRGDPDGDLLGVQIPRRPMIASRPGLGWIVDGGALRQVQIASSD
jgi:DNA segregation ATPase FtsK/SpoIIIE, S-DNA-T family